MLSFSEVASDQRREAGPPFDLLSRPSRDELFRLDRGRCAELVDARLRLLARREALGRRVLGTIADVFLKGRAQHCLGFVRLNDYSRERLGLSVRELQSVANVAAALARLPILADAFARGRLSWRQVRILVRVAKPDTENAWLAAAQGRTVRELEALVRATPSGSGSASPTPDAPNTMMPPTSKMPATPDDFTALMQDDDPDADAIDGEPMARFRLLCSRALRPLWRMTVELARRMAGEALPEWRAAEVIAAEGLSGAPVGLGPQSGDATASASVPSACRQAHDGDGTAPARDGTIPLSGHDQVALAASVPSLASLGEGVETLDAFALDGRLRAVLAALHATDWETGRLLRLLFDLRLYENLGFTDSATYIRERLGFSPRKARALVAVERATWRVPHLMDAYRAGRISWFRALLIAPVLRESTAEAWIERSGAVTARRLGDEVDWARTMEDLRSLCFAVAPPPLGAVLEIPSRQLRALADDDGVDAVLTFRGPASVVALLQSAIAAFRRPGELAWRGCERLLEHVRAEWERQPRHRDPIFARDGWRCAVPACSSRRNLHDHHVVYRSRGGDNARDNRITICAGHHLHGIHGGGTCAPGGGRPTVCIGSSVPAARRRRSSGSAATATRDRLTASRDRDA